VSNGTRKESQVSIREYRLLPHCFYGYWSRRVGKAVPFPVIVFLVIKCFVCQILHCLISGIFFSPSFLDLFPKKRLLDELLLVAGKCVRICGLWWMKGDGLTTIP